MIEVEMMRRGDIREMARISRRCDMASHREAFDMSSAGFQREWLLYRGRRKRLVTIHIPFLASHENKHGKFYKNAPAAVPLKLPKSPNER